MTSPREPNDPKDRWWNEWPLEGDPNRPAVIMTNLLSKSPRLIGWDDERMERRAREALPRGTENPSELRIGPKREVVHEVAFGLMGIAAKEITRHLLHLEDQDGNNGGNFQDTTETENEKDRVSHTAKDRITAQSFIDIPSKAAPEESGTTASMKDTDLYKLALRNLQWQRDNYLVGTDYANQRKQRKRNETSYGFTSYRMPYDTTALGNQQIVSLGEWFLPSNTVHNAALPLVVSLPSGPLSKPILRATANLIPMSQNRLDKVVKTQLISLLENNLWKEAIKTTTRGYISHTTQRRSS